MTIRSINNTNLNPNGLIELKFNEAFDKVEKVANVIEDVTALANITEEISIVADTDTINTINSIADSVSNINSVNASLEAVNNVAVKLNAIQSVSDNITAINFIKDNINNVSITYILATQFGFVGDNVTNNDAAWDSMMAFIGRDPSNSFAPPYNTTVDNKTWVVLFAKGKYRINTAKVWNKSGITLKGVHKENVEFVFVNGVKLGTADTNTRSIAINNYIRDITISSAVLDKPVVDFECTTFCELENVDIYNRFPVTGTQKTYGLRINNGQWEQLKNVRIYGCSKAGLIIDSDINNTAGNAENWSDTNYFNNVTIVMGAAVNNEICGAIMLTNRTINNNTAWHAVHQFNNCRFQVYFPQGQNEVTVTNYTTTAIFHDGTITETLIDSTISFKDCFFENWNNMLDTNNTTHFMYFDNCRYYGNNKGFFVVKDQNNKGRVTFKDCNFLGVANIFENTSNAVFLGNILFQDNNNVNYNKNKLFPTGRSYNVKSARLLVRGAEVPLKDNTFSVINLTSNTSANIRTNLYKNWEVFHILLNDISLNGVTNMRIELQHSDTTWLTSGYQSRCSKNGAMSVTSGTGFIIGENSGLPIDKALTGCLTLRLSSTASNLFILSGIVMSSTDVYDITGKINLDTNFITGLRILTNNEISTFNSGSISLRTE